MRRHCLACGDEMRRAIDRVADCVRELGWVVVETIPSPITGMEGNREFLLYGRIGERS